MNVRRSNHVDKPGWVSGGKIVTAVAEPSGRTRRTSTAQPGLHRGGNSWVGRGAVSDALPWGISTVAGGWSARIRCRVSHQSQRLARERPDVTSIVSNRRAARQ